MHWCAFFRRLQFWQKFRSDSVWLNWCGSKLSAITWHYLIQIVLCITIYYFLIKLFVEPGCELISFHNHRCSCNSYMHALFYSYKPSSLLSFSYSFIFCGGVNPTRASNSNAIKLFSSNPPAVPPLLICQHDMNSWWRMTFFQRVMMELRQRHYDYMVPELPPQRNSVWGGLGIHCMPFGSKATEMSVYFSWFQLLQRNRAMHSYEKARTRRTPDICICVYVYNVLKQLWRCILVPFTNASAQAALDI